MVTAAELAGGTPLRFIFNLIVSGDRQADENTLFITIGVSDRVHKKSIKSQYFHVSFCGILVLL
jgi:hypothetical protein